MGRELFDFAFKTYARRWAYKHPEPADFFRTMEDASGVDLDWFWRGWFYGTEPCDLSLEAVKFYGVNTRNPGVENSRLQKQRAAEPPSISDQRNAQDIKQVLVDEKPELRDFYNSYNPLTVTEADKQRYFDYLKTLTPDEQQRLSDNLNFYELNLRNVGGLITPVILQMTYDDGSQEIKSIPAEIWRKNNARSRQAHCDPEARHQLRARPLPANRRHRPEQQCLPAPARGLPLRAVRAEADRQQRRAAPEPDAAVEEKPAAKQRREAAQYAAGTGAVRNPGSSLSRVAAQLRAPETRAVSRLPD